MGRVGGWVMKDEALAVALDRMGESPWKPTKSRIRMMLLLPVHLSSCFLFCPVWQWAIAGTFPYCSHSLHLASAGYEFVKSLRIVTIKYTLGWYSFIAFGTLLYILSHLL